MKSVTEGLKREVAQLPGELLKTLTWDRGMELANHKQVTIDTGLSPIPAARGKGAAMRTPTACYAGTSPRAPA